MSETTAYEPGKIADAHDQRKAAEVPAAAELDAVMRTLRWEFYPARSIILSNANIDEARLKLISENYLSATSASRRDALRASPVAGS